MWVLLVFGLFGFLFSRLPVVPKYGSLSLHISTATIVMMSAARDQKKKCAAATLTLLYPPSLPRSTRGSTFSLFSSFLHETGINCLVALLLTPDAALHGVCLPETSIVWLRLACDVSGFIEPRD